MIKNRIRTRIRGFPNSSSKFSASLPRGIDFQKGKGNDFSRKYMSMAGIRMRIKIKNKNKLRMRTRTRGKFW